MIKVEVAAIVCLKENYDFQFSNFLSKQRRAVGSLSIKKRHANFKQNLISSFPYKLLMFVMVQVFKIAIKTFCVTMTTTKTTERVF